MDANALPVDRNTILAELRALNALAKKWRDAFKGPLPHLDTVASEEELALFMRQFSNEMRLLARKAEALAEVAVS